MPLAYAYDADSGVFRARTLAGVAQPADDYTSGFFGFESAAANATHIFAFNNAADEVHIWLRDWTPVATTISPNSPTDQYRGMGINNTHLILLNHTANQLEFYLLTNYNYDSSLTVSLDSRAWGGAARGADYLFLGNNSDDDIERRSLDGTADIDFSTGLSFALQALYASDTRVWAINRTSGAAAAFDHDGTAESGDDHAWGSGNWRASFVLPDEVTALSFGSEAIANQAWVVGTAITSLTLPEATGGTGVKTYSLSPTLPAGILFSAGNRRVSGTPTGRFSVATFTYTATDASGTTVELTFTIVVTADAITFASTIAAQAWVVGTPVSLTLPTASGGVGALTYSLSPALPSGVSRTDFDVSGTPTGRFSSATFTYTVTDAENVVASQTFTVVVTAVAISFAANISNQNWIVGTAVSVTLPSATGGAGTLTYSLTPTLPAGITFTAASRALAGNPTGRFTVATFTYTVTDAESVTHTQTFTVVVTAPAITFNPTSFSDQIWQVDMAVSLTLPEATGGAGTLTATLTGTLPSGVSFTASLRLLAGNPSAEFAVATFTYTMTDAEGISASISFTILVNPIPPPNAGYFFDLAELVETEYPDAEFPIVIQNEDGDDAIAKRATRSIAQALLAIPTLRDAEATYALIQDLLDYEDLQNKPGGFTRLVATVEGVANTAQTLPFTYIRAGSETSFTANWFDSVSNLLSDTEMSSSTRPTSVSFDPTAPTGTEQEISSITFTPRSSGTLYLIIELG